MFSTGTQSCLRFEYRSCNPVLLCSSVNSERKGQYMYKSYMKNALSLGKHCFLPLFANVIKNKITRSLIYIYI